MYLAILLIIQPMPAPDISGVYSIVGREGDSAYIGSANIHKNGDGYAVQMSVATVGEDGELKAFSHVLAVGLRSGDVLSVGWQSGKVVGVTVYTIKGDTLTGVWLTLPGHGAVRGETLKRIGPLPKAPAGGGA